MHLYYAYYIDPFNNKDNSVNKEVECNLRNYIRKNIKTYNINAYQRGEQYASALLSLDNIKNLENCLLQKPVLTIVQIKKYFLENAPFSKKLLSEFDKKKSIFINSIAKHSIQHRVTFAEFLTNEGENMLDKVFKMKVNTSMSSILNGSGSQAATSFQALYERWFDKKKYPTDYLGKLKEAGIPLERMSSILNGSGSQAATSFQALYDIWFDKQGDKTIYLQTLDKQEMDLERIVSILSGCGAKGAQNFKEFYGFLFESNTDNINYLENIRKAEIPISGIATSLNRAGVNAIRAFKDVYSFFIDKNGQKTEHLKNINNNQIKLHHILRASSRASTHARAAIEGLYHHWFNEIGEKTEYLSTLDKNGLNIEYVTKLLHGAGSRIVEAYKKLYDLWFKKDNLGNIKKRKYLRVPENHKIDRNLMFNLLYGTGFNIADAYKDLYNLWFDKRRDPKLYLKTILREDILQSVSEILYRSGTKVKEAHKKLFDLWFKEDNLGNMEMTKYLEVPKSLVIPGRNIKKGNTKKTYLKSMTRILTGVGPTNVARVYKDLFDLWFNEEGNKTDYLKNIEQYVNIDDMSNILFGAGIHSKDAFEALADLLIDQNGKTRYLIALENNKDSLTLSDMANILYNAGAGRQFTTRNAYKNLYDLWFTQDGEKTQRLKHLEENGVSLYQIRDILYHSGPIAPEVFLALYNLWFEKDGKKTKCLKDLENSGMDLPKICSSLNKKGSKAKSAFIKLCHETNPETETEVLDELDIDAPIQEINIVEDKSQNIIEDQTKKRKRESNALDKNKKHKSNTKVRKRKINTGRSGVCK